MMIIKLQSGQYFYWIPDVFALRDFMRMVRQGTEPNQAFLMVWRATSKPN
jgi:hypothetical protein